MPVVLSVFVELGVKSLEIEPSNIVIIKQKLWTLLKPIRSVSGRGTLDTRGFFSSATRNFVRRRSREKKFGNRAWKAPGTQGTAVGDSMETNGWVYET